MQSADSATKFLSLREAAKFLKISPEKLYRLVFLKAITFYKPAGKLYFKESDLIEWIEAGKKPVQIEAGQG